MGSVRARHVSVTKSAGKFKASVTVQVPNPKELADRLSANATKLETTISNKLNAIPGLPHKIAVKNIQAIEVTLKKGEEREDVDEAPTTSVQGVETSLTIRGVNFKSLSEEMLQKMKKIVVD